MGNVLLPKLVYYFIRHSENLQNMRFMYNIFSSENNGEQVQI